MYKQKFLVIVFVFVSILTVICAFLPRLVMASLTGSAITLVNSRLSYKANVAAGTSGSSIITITNSGYPDINTNHLFPGDTVCFTDEGQNGCIGSTSYTVDSLIDATHFNLTSPLSDNLDTSGYAVATHSGTWTVAFTNGGGIPSDGSILITIPMADNAKGNNGIPDSAGTVANSGFDLNSVAAANVTITGCTDANWGTPVVTAGSGTGNHTIAIPRNTTACTGGSNLVITIAGPGIVNPAPVTSGHTQGTSDVYGVTIATRDGSSNVIETATPRAAVTEAVLISTTVDENLSFIVGGLAAGTYCGNSTITTTATSVPWGRLASTNAFYYAAQQLTVSTNAASGYTVTIQENDQMGKNGNACTGTAPSAGNYTFGANNCIRDTVCGASNCSESVAADWTDATSYPGLGYSIANQSGTDASFTYSDSGRAFNSKQLADKVGGETPAVVMNNAGPVSGSSIYLCYRISVPGNQPAGYYYNIAKYTATATF